MRFSPILAALAIAMGRALTGEALFKTGLKSLFRQAAIFSVALLALMEISSPLRAVETASKPPSGPAAQAILRWFTTDRSLGCDDPCTVEDNGPMFEVYYGDSTGGGPQADVLAFVYYWLVPEGKMMGSAVAYFHREGGDYRFIKTLIADKAAPATRKQFMDLTAAIHTALRKRDGVTVVGEGAPAKWRLKEGAD
jgi:hypothetical protein